MSFYRVSMKLQLIVVILLVVVRAHAELLAALSILPDLAFFFTNETNLLCDVNGTTFSRNAEFPRRTFFDTKYQGQVKAASYILPIENIDHETFFFKGKRIFHLSGNSLNQVPGGVKQLFVNGPGKVDAAFSVVNGSREVIGTNFIFKKEIFECGVFRSTCTRSLLKDYAKFTNFLKPRGLTRIQAALGLSNGVTVLFREGMYAVIHKKGGVAEERESFF